MHPVLDGRDISEGNLVAVACHFAPAERTDVVNGLIAQRPVSLATRTPSPASLSFVWAEVMEEAKLQPADGSVMCRGGR